jgi:hypothetical protein
MKQTLGIVIALVLLSSAGFAVYKLTMIGQGTEQQAQETSQPPTMGGQASNNTPVVNPNTSTGEGVRIVAPVPESETEKITLSQEAMDRVVEQASSIEYENEYMLIDTELYTIYVISHAQYFNVILKQFPYSPGRVAAEAYLSELLGMTGKELCQLNIDVFAPSEFDPLYSQDLGLSECPGPYAAGNL